MASSAIGIDFGHSQVKIVEVRRRNRQVAIKRAMLLPIPQGTLSNGTLLDPVMLAASLAEIHSGIHLNRSVIVAGITGSKVTVRQLSLSNVPVHELPQAIPQELASLLRLGPEEMENHVFDYHYLPSVSPTEHEVVAVGIETSAVLAYADLLRQARLAPHILDVEAFALPYVSPIAGRACYIELGAENTQIFVTSDGEYMLYRLIPLGTRHLNEAVAKAYNTTPAEALALLNRTHIDTLVTDAPGDRTDIQSHLMELSGSILQTLEFLRVRQRTSSVGELLSSALLCGGGAMQLGMAHILSEELGIPVEIMHPFANLPGVEHLPPDIASLDPLFAGALGLALRGVDEL